MSLIQIITESRKDTFISKFSNKFTPEQLESIVQNSEKIPGQNKYLTFMGNTINPKNFKDDLSIVTKLLERFSSVGSNLPLKDINQYKNIAELRNALNEYDNRVRREIKTVDDADVVYEDDNLTVVMPKTYKASCQFGAGTKWCTTSKDSPHHFFRYYSQGILIYCINKITGYKVAVFWDVNDESSPSFWNVLDNQIDSMMTELPPYILKHIRNLPKTSNKSLCDEKTLQINAKYDCEVKKSSEFELLYVNEETPMYPQAEI